MQQGIETGRNHSEQRSGETMGASAASIFIPPFHSSAAPEAELTEAPHLLAAAPVTPEE